MAVGDDYHPQGADTAPIPEGRTTRSYDWPGIRKTYVEGVKNDSTGMMEWPSLDSVATMYGVRADRVRQKSAAEGWVGERDRWRKEVEQARRRARANALSQTSTNIEGKATETAQLGLQLAAARLRELGQTQAARQRNEGGGTHAAIDALELGRLAQAADLFHKIGLRALGLNSDGVRVELTGANGGPIEITQELARADPTRIRNVLGVLSAAGLDGVFEDDDDILDAEEVVEHLDDLDPDTAGG